MLIALTPAYVTRRDVMPTSCGAGGLPWLRHVWAAARTLRKGARPQQRLRRRASQLVSISRSRLNLASSPQGLHTCSLTWACPCMPATTLYAHAQSTHQRACETPSLPYHDRRASSSSFSASQGSAILRRRSITAGGRRATQTRSSRAKPTRSMSTGQLRAGGSNGNAPRGFHPYLR